MSETPLSRVEELLDELVRLHAIQLRETVESQAEAIVMMYRAGLSPSRIAALLRTSAGTVNVAVSRAKKRGDLD